MSAISKEEDFSSVSADSVQPEADESHSKDAHKFRPMQPVLSASQPSSLPDSTDSTPSDAAETDRPKPNFGGGSFKMPIFKGPVRKISKVKSLNNLPEKSFADSTTTSSQPAEKNENKINLETDSYDNKLKKTSKRSPAEKLATPPPPYREPAWSGIPEDEYYLEVLRGGAIWAKIGLNDHPFHLFGRLETNHVQLDHPSLSRYHAVLQYRSVGDNDHDPGFYLYDLGSTHGTTLNKKQIEAKVYCRIQVGHMFKLAGSTRLYILQGGNTEAEEKGKDLSIEQLKDMQLRRMEEKELLMMKEDGEKEEVMEDDSNTGISWGMAEDADAESDLAHNPFALDIDDDKEAPYLKDPKKALRGFFEREGDELEYNVEEMGIGRSHEYVCKVVLPLDDASGNPITAEATVSGKKKEAVLACALEACKILDRHGVLRQAKHESKKRKDKNWAADDYYDSDDDTFLDRTGEIEKKRIKRMRKAGAEKQEALTYDKLLLQLQELEKEIKKVEDTLATLAGAKVDHMAEDSLDAFMDSIKSGFKDRNQRAKLKIRLVDLRKEELKLKKLINIAKPTKMPELKGSSTGDGTSSSAKPKMQAMIGKMHGAKKFRFAPLVSKLPAVTVSSPPEEEVEEDELDDDSKMDVQEPECQSDPNSDPNQFKENELKTGSKSSNTSEGSLGSSTSAQQYDEKPVATSGSEQPELAPKGPSRPPVKGSSFHPSSSAVSLPRGPSFPPNYEKDDVKDEEEERKPTLYAKQRKVLKEAINEEVHDWTPPKGQTGDGRTSLNDKFGY